MQMGNGVPSLADCTGGVKNYEDRLDDPPMRAQNLATLSARVGISHGNSRGLAGQGARAELALLQQRHPELEGGDRRERPQCARVGYGGRQESSCSWGRCL